ncbi:MAG TPA: hypothetical protein VHS53_03035 [Mucilaginibacter sp.]|jgi:hypothetical protein|nr:hypothetical protein [Mucilaginibacter sp.]
MRKFLAAVVFVLGSALLLAAMDQTLINKLKQDRYFDHLTPPNAGKNSMYHRLLIRSDRWRYGDLFGLSFLPGFKFKLEPFKTYPKEPGRPVSKKVLYISGDSFLADKTLTGAFDGFDDVIYLDRRFQFGPIRLDSSKENYLVMEFTERGLIGYNIDKTGETKWTESDLKARANFNIAAAAKGPVFKLPTSIWERLNNTLFNKNLSRNLELLLFDDKIFTPAKELKATINYKLLGRVDKNVAVSTDKKRLFVNGTVDTASKLSDFRPLSDKEIDTIVNNLDAANRYYRSIGFRKVVLTVIPNAVSVYDEKRAPYNRLLERVEQGNRFPVVDVYGAFMHAQVNLYYRSDTHWNPAGLDLWIKAMNQSIKTW